MLAHIVELALISSIMLFFGMIILIIYVLYGVLALPSWLLSKAKKGMNAHRSAIKP